MNTPDLSPSRLRALLEKATPGPWTKRPGFIVGSFEQDENGARGTAVCSFGREYHLRRAHAANAELLALSRAMAERIIELENELRAIYEQQAGADL